MTPGTVYLMQGFRCAMARPADCRPATDALRAAIVRRGKKWRRVAPRFGLLPAGPDVVVGVMLQKSPLAYDVPSWVYPGSALLRRHVVVPAPLESEAVDDHAVAIHGLEPACEAIETELSKLGLGVPRGEPARLLVSPTGAAGVVVAGAVSDAEVPLETWCHNTEDGTRVRVVGVALARVDADTSIEVLPRAADWADREALRRIGSDALARAGIDQPAGLFLIGT